MEEHDLDSSAPISLTQAGHLRLKEELLRLTVEKRADIAARIRDSKDHGEYSEDNSELDEVKVEQAIVENRISELKNILANAEVLTEDMIPVDHVGLGSKVTVRDAVRGIEFEVQVVASEEANPDDDLISMESPMGQALMGKPVGGFATFEAPVGVLKYEILSITR